MYMYVYVIIDFEFLITGVVDKSDIYLANSVSVSC